MAQRGSDIPTTPVQDGYRRSRRRRRWCAALVLYLLGIWVYWGIFAEVPVDYRDDEEHFLYGSIGSDREGGIPYWIWRVLPEMFPEYLPNPKAFASLNEDERDGLNGYRQFGFIVEENRDRPIGFSKRRFLVDRIGLNCAVCHVGTVQGDAGTEGFNAHSIYGKPARYVKDSAKPNQNADYVQRAIVLGMPAATVDLQGYFEFLFACAGDPRFTPDNVLSYIEQRTRLGPLEKYFYRRAVPELRNALLLRKKQLSYFKQIPRFGPGRVDTFGPYKTMVFGFSYDGACGTADFPSLWNQGPRAGMQLHWDGNNTSVFERNISASLGAGATPTSLDMLRMLRVARWIGSPRPKAAPEGSAGTSEWKRDDIRELPIPSYPFPIDRELADRGREHYMRKCAACHDFDGKRIGRVKQLDPDDVNATDRERLDSYTVEISVNQNTLGAGHWWRFRSFRKTNGYVNAPLDGIWARGPYLHNGSVPTLRDLLNKASERPKYFFRGDDRYDTKNVGFRSHAAEAKRAVEQIRQIGSGPPPTGEKLAVLVNQRFPINSTDGRRLFFMDTTLRGNGNHGHEYGTELKPEEKDALLEFLKTKMNYEE